MTKVPRCPWIRTVLGFNKNPMTTIQILCETGGNM